MKTNKYFFDFFKNKKYEDDFGYHPSWNKEVNKWLRLICKLNKTYYKIGKTDIKTTDKRDAFLGECKSIYYCYKFLKGKKFEVEAKTPIDFKYERNGIKFFVEVKSPSWHGEVFKNDNLKKNQQKKRKKKPQYINGEGYSFSPRDAIKDSIKNSLHKFEKNQKNILMITPNMFVPLHKSPNWHVKNIVNDELSKQDKDNLISVVAILETQESKNKIEYLYSEYKK